MISGEVRGKSSCDGNGNRVEVQGRESGKLRKLEGPNGVDRKPLAADPIRSAPTLTECYRMATWVI